MEQNWNNYLDVVDIQQNSFSKTFNAALVLEQTQTTARLKVGFEL